MSYQAEVWQAACTMSSIQKLGPITAAVPAWMCRRVTMNFRTAAHDLAGGFSKQLNSRRIKASVIQADSKKSLPTTHR
jgi:hypothetical protein|tara:strand:+ start:362 stop:595 length:234 start_codon:yes stop_codon:yes gene_type:complete